MHKNYHEHCKEEHEQALHALAKAQEAEKNNAVISFYVTSTRKQIISVPRRKLKFTLAKLKKAGKRIIDVKT